ncbi:mitochondrial RNA helicase SUPV3L1 [Andalucia godoyi]|uniref:RNA helicase n=1 Tax=Andalucia godoyi TaxID=505711 RepID=A0A8K0AIW7_ANDGO|nr:mitochondrial RNA helicase SUPV3L1 [Andalucia godoyi]|eukprot:ANDGO_03748.mRNA.1 mitochondrial RNA helicase SUPV3L1
MFSKVFPLFSNVYSRLSYDRNLKNAFSVVASRRRLFSSFSGFPIEWNAEFVAKHGLDERLFNRCRRLFEKQLRKDNPSAGFDLLSDASNSNRQSSQSGLFSSIPDIEESFVKFAKQRFSQQMTEMRQLSEFSDLRTPEESYPFARAMKRRFVFHAGPTNSGKTHSALSRLKDPSVRKGIYCAPLRLLALEIFDKFNNAGVPCDLLTGEERKEKADSRVLSCTVEMASTTSKFDVAVIDEIQMVGDESRGWAWTRALLGLCASEIHLCGEKRALHLVKSILENCGEAVELFEYERLTPCNPERSSLSSSLKSIQAGDAVIAFSRRNIFKLKYAIEKQTGLQCAVVYGNLPPPVRALQAQKFNSLECPVLVASDAVAMGLNMQISRVVFSTMMKFNGHDFVPLERSLIRQIGGRAGRFGSKYPDGYVTCLHPEDMHQLHDAFSEKNPANIELAGLKPTFEQIAQFSEYLPQCTFGNVLERFVSLTQLNQDFYFVCDFEDEKIIADAIERIPGLLLEDRYTFCCSPADTDNFTVMSFLLRFAASHARGEKVILHVPLPSRPPTTEASLQKLESLYNVVDLYLWLSYRFPATFCEREHAASIRDEARRLIEAGLDLQTKHRVESGDFVIHRSRRRDALLHQQQQSILSSGAQDGVLTNERKVRKKWKRHVADSAAESILGPLGEEATSDARMTDYRVLRVES